MTVIGITVRKAVIADIHAILELINSYAANGIMLPRTEFEMAENIRDFSVAYDDDGRLLGCGALHFYTPTTAEVRSLAVRPELKQHGVGRAIVESLEKEARENGLQSIFAFTYAPGFFSKVGFGEIERGELPLKAWKDCLRCPKFQNCDEIAVLKWLRPAEAHLAPTFEAHDSFRLLQIEPALLPRIAPDIAEKKLKY